MFKNKIIVLLIFIIFLFFGVFIKNNTNRVIQNSDRIIENSDRYLNYSQNNFEYSKQKGKTLLFFAAVSWCSSCRIVDQGIKDRFTELPDDLTVLKVDYDNDLAMKEKYDVVYQTTLILLDKNGEEIKRWIGTDFDSVLNNLN